MFADLNPCGQAPADYGANILGLQASLDELNKQQQENLYFLYKDLLEILMSNFMTFNVKPFLLLQGAGSRKEAKN